MEKKMDIPSNQMVFLFHEMIHKNHPVLTQKFKSIKCEKLIESTPNIFETVYSYHSNNPLIYSILPSGIADQLTQFQIDSVMNNNLYDISFHVTPLLNQFYKITGSISFIKKNKDWYECVMKISKFEIFVSTFPISSNYLQKKICRHILNEIATDLSSLMQANSSV